MEDIKKKFGEKVRYYRMKKGLTQWELADKADLHYTYVGSIERGEKNITLKNINRIADALNTKITDLLDFDQSELEEIEPDDLLKLKLSKILRNKSEKEIKRLFKILKDILNLQNMK